MRILVFGGAGYIGSHTALELIRAGEEVVVADNLQTGFRYRQVFMGWFSYLLHWKQDSFRLQQSKMPESS